MSTNQKGCLGLLLQIFGFNVEQSQGRKSSRHKKNYDYPYRVRDAFLTPAELSFYHTLKSVTGDNVVVLTKVRLWDIFFVARPNQNPGARPHIDRKHIDFLLCDPQTMQPRAGIELDDSSHARPDRQKRDAAVATVFATAELPLLRFPVQRTYHTRALQNSLAPYLRLQANTSDVLARPTNEPEQLQNVVGNAKLCPRCGSSMMLRVANKGKHKGKQFYGCTAYPDCKMIIPADN